MTYMYTAHEQQFKEEIHVIVIHLIFHTIIVLLVKSVGRFFTNYVHLEKRKKNIYIYMNNIKYIMPGEKNRRLNF